MPRKKTAGATDAPPEPTQDAPEVSPATEPMTSRSEASQGDVDGAAPKPAPPQSSGKSEKPRPAYKVGPIATDKNNAVSAAVWANEHTDRKDDRTFTVYNVTVHAEWRDADGSWKPAKSVRGSHLYALIYCLQRCSEWILAQRDPANDCPF
jgi:hypothetical protein